LIVIAFSTPYWIVPEEGAVVSTQLEKLGLWEICFSGYYDHRDSFGRTYNGCWWIFAREYDAIRKYLITGELLFLLSRGTTANTYLHLKCNK
jgi:hypothetical protein